jgi:hypothetical protein
MSTFSHHRLLDDRRLHLVSLFQRIYWNLLLSSLRLLRSPLFTTRYGVSDVRSPGLADRDIGVFGDIFGLSYCTIPSSGCQAGLEYALLSVGWSCRLPFMLALVHHICGAHIANCRYCFPFHFSLRLASGQWTLPEVYLSAWRLIGPRLVLSVRLDHFLTILDTLSSF